MTLITGLIALAIEVLKLIRGSGGVSSALAEIQKVNQAIDQVRTAVTPEEKQNAAAAISRTISGDD